MKAWENSDNLKCVFCKKVQDSHDHLFFECEFTGLIWARLKVLVKRENAPNCWYGEKYENFPKFIKLLRYGVSMFRELLEGKRFPFLMIQNTNFGLVMKDESSYGLWCDIFLAYMHLMDMKTDVKAGIGIDRRPFRYADSCMGVWEDKRISLYYLVSKSIMYLNSDIFEVISFLVYFPKHVLGMPFYDIFSGVVHLKI
ncbi:hypothetical protein Tco_0434592 [Tanacetum coccineum]